MSEEIKKIAIKVDKKISVGEMKLILQNNFSAKVEFINQYKAVVEAKISVRSKSGKIEVVCTSITEYEAEKTGKKEEFSVKCFEVTGDVRGVPFFVADSTWTFNCYESQLFPEEASMETIKELYDMGLL